jgi:hypothetical protein
VRSISCSTCAVTAPSMLKERVCRYVSSDASVVPALLPRGNSTAPWQACRSSTVVSMTATCTVHSLQQPSAKLSMLGCARMVGDVAGHACWTWHDDETMRAMPTGSEDAVTVETGRQVACGTQCTRSSVNSAMRTCKPRLSEMAAPCRCW